MEGLITMQYSLVDFNEIEKVETYRFDAEYFKPEYLEIERVVKNKTGSFTSLHNLNLKIDTSAFYPSLEPFYNSGDLPFLRVSDTNKFIDYENAIKIPEEILPEFPTLKVVHEGDILITKGGSVARIGRVDKKVAVSRDLIFINSSSLNEIESCFLYVYCLTNTYQKLLVRSSSMTAQPHLTLTLVKEIPILSPSTGFKKKIFELYKRAHSSLLESIGKYQSASDTFLSNLGLKGWEAKSSPTYVVNFNETVKESRLDAEFYRPRYQDVLKYISKYELTTISKEFDLIRSNNFSYTENDRVGVIKTKQLAKHFINFDVESTTSLNIVEKENLPIIKNKDVLFASMGVGSLGKTNIFFGFEAAGLDEYTIDSTLKIFRQKVNAKVTPEVLCIFLSSSVGTDLIYKYIVGSSGIISIYENYLRQFPIPVLPLEIQDNISTAVRKAHQSKHNSKLLLDIAVRGVEIAIEFNETKAMEFIDHELGTKGLT